MIRIMNDSYYECLSQKNLEVSFLFCFALFAVQRPDVVDHWSPSLLDNQQGTLLKPYFRLNESESQEKDPGNLFLKALIPLRVISQV